MIVYRVEDDDYNGPYNGKNKVTPIPSDNQPTPGNDIEGWYDLSFDNRHEYLFGFTDIIQLFNWFDDNTLNRLAIYRFHIGVYEVPEDNVMYGSAQVAFHTSKVKRIKEIMI